MDKYHVLKSRNNQDRGSGLSENLFEKVSNKVLLGAVTLDALLGNPLMTYAQDSSGNKFSSDDSWIYWLCAGTALEYAGSKVYKSNKGLGIGITATGIFLSMVGIFKF